MQFKTLPKTAGTLFAMITVASSPLTAQETSTTPLDQLRLSAAKADELVVYEGLPSSQKDESSLVQELSRKDVVILCSQAFYAPGASASQSPLIREIITDADSIKTYSGQKDCGPFHPDYVVCWQVDGISRYIFIGLECGEIIYCSPQVTRQYDLTADALKKLQVAFQPYAKKRPEN
ncbi:hypothetical protein SAMN02745181_3213 [Rubritalea squalenifaciens DSM 18772]|uniref:Uncharacterized protein n=1 Tax=Rubritalea squalenifaciens DSM 18772 TaxID=1123071 RepID=A0A1M6PK27_9BACT|nr:hypothetical protein [Rubritalea squalenifaciens]SHK08257.1 hypothetical protein SAMN02745181_3213 [Rubritalea squalenifaciens DSM 18772]